MRVRTAQRMLLERSQPIAEVARALGFADPSHFTRTFRRAAAGCTPAAWLRSRRLTATVRHEL
jgi:AraC-like DNA-binding protein